MAHFSIVDAYPVARAQCVPQVLHPTHRLAHFPAGFPCLFIPTVFAMTIARLQTPQSLETATLAFHCLLWVIGSCNTCPLLLVVKPRSKFAYFPILSATLVMCREFTYNYPTVSQCSFIYSPCFARAVCSSSLQPINPSHASSGTSGDAATPGVEAGSVVGAVVCQHRSPRPSKHDFA